MPDSANGQPWPLDLLDWKRRVGTMYAAVRDGQGSETAVEEFRRAKDDLFARHTQSPILVEARESFSGLSHFPYDAAMRLSAELEPDVAGGELIIPSSTGEPFRFALIGHVRFAIAGRDASLAVFWLSAYGGGLFVPFRDESAGVTTYGGGRYLLDTVKGADLGTTSDGRLILDFNYAYNPSCSYDPRWSCPLAPPSSRLDVAIEAGERTTPK